MRGGVTQTVYTHVCKNDKIKGERKNKFKKLSLKKKNSGQVLVVSCNPSYSGGSLPKASPGQIVCKTIS
jgi:hypothetical protein